MRIVQPPSCGWGLSNVPLTKITPSHLGGARPVRSSGGMGSVSVNTGREVPMVNIPLENNIKFNGGVTH